MGRLEVQVGAARQQALRSTSTYLISKVGRQAGRQVCRVPPAWLRSMVQLGFRFDDDLARVVGL